MAKYIRTDKLQDNLFIPVKLSDQIIKGTLAHTIKYLVDNRIDISIFESKIKNDETGRPAYNPKVLLKLVFYAYAKGIISSRKIQALAKENLVAMALAENTAPDFTVIAAFVSGMKDEISSVFVNILLVAEEMELLGNTVFPLCQHRFRLAKKGKFKREDFI